MSKVLLLAGILLLACCSKERITGSGNIVIEQRNVSNFTKVSTTGGTNVHIIQGNSFKVEVKGYQNLLTHMQTAVVGTTLEVGYRNQTNIKNDNVEVFVTMPTLAQASTSGSGNINVKGSFTGTDLKVSLSGSSNIYIEAGTVDNFKADMSGSGNVKAFGLNAQKADISLTGSGTAEVKALSNLKVSISGSGVVYYKGQPVIETNISGSGRLEHRP